mmetsp:Transcript_19006/g.38765  ORF Transcript_19006/g.38765 Transcript_19006/m.38765 type:complete len:348 (+) Transcript_19006:332-1375(+)
MNPLPLSRSCSRVPIPLRCANSHRSHIAPLLRRHDGGSDCTAHFQVDAFCCQGPRVTHFPKPFLTFRSRFSLSEDVRLQDMRANGRNGRGGLRRFALERRGPRLSGLLSLEHLASHLGSGSERAQEHRVPAEEVVGRLSLACLGGGGVVLLSELLCCRCERESWCWRELSEDRGVLGVCVGPGVARRGCVEDSEPLGPGGVGAKCVHDREAIGASACRVHEEALGVLLPCVDQRRTVVSRRIVVEDTESLIGVARGRNIDAICPRASVIDWKCLGVKALGVISNCVWSRVAGCLGVPDGETRGARGVVVVDVWDRKAVLPCAKRIDSKRGRRLNSREGKKIEHSAKG